MTNKKNVEISTKLESIEDGMIYPDEPHYAIAERAFRRGFHHGVVEIATHAKNIPFYFRYYARMYEDAISDWRWSFNSKDNPVCPPQAPPYSESAIADYYYLSPCGVCGGKGHLVNSEKGWSVICTGKCKRQTFVSKSINAAADEWDVEYISRTRRPFCSPRILAKVGC